VRAGSTAAALHAPDTQAVRQLLPPDLYQSRRRVHHLHAHRRISDGYATPHVSSVRCTSPSPGASTWSMGTAAAAAAARPLGGDLQAQVVGLHASGEEAVVLTELKRLGDSGRHRGDDDGPHRHGEAAGEAPEVRARAVVSVACPHVLPSPTQRHALAHAAESSMRITPAQHRPQGCLLYQWW
jgi:hypothetical protein